VFLLGPVAGSSAPTRNVATSQAFAIRITVPGQAPVTAGYVSAPNDSTAAEGGFAYPGDGSVLTTGSISAAASANGEGTAATGVATAEINGISLFGGEVTVQVVDAKLTATAGTGDGTGDFTGTGATGIGGSAVAGSQLGDWGTLASAALAHASR